ncbi:hypothetical protein [Plastoroseomonas hellenica]|uniref:hypothetical protein n=1 Tax=Plastoroseomonas hellenica TaxID=2687306 RepID=UPI001BA44780|nr:hypothetical protein [Plastoroseomonas hellenica]MBR0645693.1 hypothetical protein [Plastoroseomonas hellenica]
MPERFMMLRRATLSCCLILLSAGAALAQKGDPGQAAPAPNGSPSLRLQNATPNIVNNVYASPSSDSNWGEDRLGANEVIQPRGNRAFSLPPGECVYDVRVVYQGGVAEERLRVDACSDTIVALPMAAQRLR